MKVFPALCVQLYFLKAAVQIWVTVSNSISPAVHCLCYLCAVCAAQAEHRGTGLNDGKRNESRSLFPEQLESKSTEQGTQVGSQVLTMQLSSVKSLMGSPRFSGDKMMENFKIFISNMHSDLFCKAETNPAIDPVIKNLRWVAVQGLPFIIFFILII